MTQYDICLSIKTFRRTLSQIRLLPSEKRNGSWFLHIRTRGSLLLANLLLWAILTLPNLPSTLYEGHTRNLPSSAVPKHQSRARSSQIYCRPLLFCLPLNGVAIPQIGVCNVRIMRIHFVLQWCRYIPTTGRSLICWFWAPFKPYLLSVIYHLTSIKLSPSVL